MSTLEQLRDGLNKAWESVTVGWRDIVDRAGEALTRFHPTSSDSEVQTREDHIAHRSARWGLLAAELRLSDEAVEVSLEVPGMQPTDFEIQVTEDVLVIRGEKKVSRDRSEGRYQIMERAYGAFERAVRLPVSVDDSQAQARYEHGVLHLTLPRSAASRSRRIEVKTG